MLRTLSKIAVGIGVLLILIFAALAALLPRLIESEQIQAALRTRATEALGAPVDWTHLEAGLLPPRLVLQSPRLVSEAADAGATALSADSIDLRLSLSGLLRRRVEIDSLVLHGVELVVTRTADGLRLPIGRDGSSDSAAEAVVSPGSAATTPGETPSQPEAPAADDAESSFVLDLRRLSVEGGRIVLHDRVLAEPVDWQLEDLRLEARGRGEGEPIEVEASARLTSGTRAVGDLAAKGTLTLAGGYDLRVSSEPVDFVADLDLGDRGKAHLGGRIALDGALDAKIELDAFDIAPFASLAARGDEEPIRLAGRATGRIDLALMAEKQLTRLTTDLQIRSAHYANGTIDLGGEVDLRLDLRRGVDRTLEGIDADLRVEKARFVRAPVDLAGSATFVMRLEGAGPATVEGQLRLADGGRLDLKGSATLDGVLDVAGRMEHVDLAIAAPFLPGPDVQIGGFATGRLQLLGAATEPRVVGLDVGVESGRLRIPDYAVDGPFSMKIDVKEPLSGRPRGRIELDLTAAHVRYRDQFEKSAGMRAEMVSRFTSDAKGEIVFESRIKLRNIDEILLQGLVGESISLVVTTPDFDLDGWSEVFPGLLLYAPTGPIALEGLGVELIDGASSRFSGRLQLRDVALRVPDVGPVRVRGQLLGEGTVLRTQGLEMLVGGVTLAIVGRVDDPMGDARYELGVKSVGVSEVNGLLSALSSTRDTLFGPLELDGRISGSTRDATDFYDGLQGRFDFTIGRQGGGRLRGVSILRTFLDQIPLVAGATRLAQSWRGSRSVEDYLGEQFEIIEGKFEIGGGRVEARMLRLAYRGYEVGLSGPLQLEDLSIDMTGEILLKGDLVSVLAGVVGNTAAIDRPPVRIPLARVTNTLSDPKLKLTPETLAAVPRLLFQATGLDALSTGIGKALGRVLGGAPEGR